MEIAKSLVLSLKQKNKSHVGYGLQKECESLVGHILQNMIRSQLPVLNPRKKDREESLRYREEGNQQFVIGDDIDAIKSYTLSLAYADSKELMAYAVANRSAALYRKGMYQECLIDIDAALSLGYPEEKRKKLEERGIKALEEIKKMLNVKQYEHIDMDDIMSQLCSRTNTKEPAIMKSKEFQGVCCTQDNITVGKNAQPNDESKDKMFNSNIDMQSKKDKKKVPRYVEDGETLELTYGPSKEVPAVSNGIEVNFCEKFGRHYIATQNFKPGDILTIEDPYAHVIYEDKFYTHCHQCLTRCYNLMPCPKCPIAQYCSEQCRMVAWQVAHCTECCILMLLPNLLNVDKDKIRMLMKIIRLLIVVTENGSMIGALREDTMMAETNPDSRTAGFTKDGILDSTSARSALSLATNMTTRPLVGISAFACISALAALLLATETNFFTEKYQLKQLNDISNCTDLIFCAGLMFRACVIMSSNCFSVQEEPGIKSGSGLYVAHSLYNHSCAPNTFRHFEGVTMITRALEPISPGDQIFTSYGTGYAYMSKSERKQKLMQDYFFDCQCPACTSDWPTYNEILRNHIGSIVKNKELVDKLKPFKERLLTNMYDIDAVKRVLSILHDEVVQPCEEVVHAEQYLKSYYLDP